MASENVTQPGDLSDEPKITISDDAKRLQWSYSTTLRHFEYVDGVIIKPGPKKRGRSKRKISIPETVFKREYLTLTTRRSVVEEADKRMLQLRGARSLKVAS